MRWLRPNEANFGLNDLRNNAKVDAILLALSTFLTRRVSAASMMFS